MKGGLSWCWDRVSGAKEQARSWITHVFANRKEKLPENGSLPFFISCFFCQKKGLRESAMEG